MTDSQLRVLHAPSNPAGQATTISRAQRELGIKSDVLVFNQNYLEFDVDIDLKIDSRPWGTRILGKKWNFLKYARKYDVFHFHFGRSLLPLNLDLGLLRMMGKKMVMQYWGSDIMQIDIAKKYTLFDEKMLRKLLPGIDDEKQRRKIAKINRKVGASLVGDYSLVPFSPESRVVRQALDISKFPFVGVEPKESDINIVHAPTKRVVKGTDLILPAIERLRKEGFRVNTVLVENMPHEKAVEVFKTADIVVDDILQGPYGLLAMECMALGKPVLGRIDQHFAGMYKDLPIVSTDPSSIYENLKALATDPARRAELGRKGRAYIEVNHDAKVIAQQLIDVYKSL